MFDNLFFYLLPSSYKPSDEEKRSSQKEGRQYSILGSEPLGKDFGKICSSLEKVQKKLSDMKSGHFKAGAAKSKKMHVYSESGISVDMLSSVSRQLSRIEEKAKDFSSKVLTQLNDTADETKNISRLIVDLMGLKSKIAQSEQMLLELKKTGKKTEGFEKVIETIDETISSLDNAHKSKNNNPPTESKEELANPETSSLFKTISSYKETLKDLRPMEGPNLTKNEKLNIDTKIEDLDDLSDNNSELEKLIRSFDGLKNLKNEEDVERYFESFEDTSESSSSDEEVLLIGENSSVSKHDQLLNDLRKFSKNEINLIAKDVESISLTPLIDENKKIETKEVLLKTSEKLQHFSDLVNTLDSNTKNKLHKYNPLNKIISEAKSICAHNVDIQENTIKALKNFYPDELKGK